MPWWVGRLGIPAHSAHPPKKKEDTAKQPIFAMEDFVKGFYRYRLRHYKAGVMGCARINQEGVKHGWGLRRGQGLRRGCPRPTAGTASFMGRAGGLRKDTLASHGQLLLKHGYYSIIFQAGCFGSRELRTNLR